MGAALLLGVLQGLTEWLPVSSQGVVTVAQTALLDRTLSEAVTYALWLHAGTACAALVALRREAWGVIQDAAARPLSPSSRLRFLVVGTVVSAAVGIPIVLALGELSDRLGALGMGVVGVLMMATGALQLRRVRPDADGQGNHATQGGHAAQGNHKGCPYGPDARGHTDLTVVDALAAGVAQGLAALPGLSRSGLTIAALLGRRIERGEALVLSYLMSIPASLGAGIIALLDGGAASTWPALAAAAVACGVGLATIRALLAFAQRVNLGGFVAATGAVMAAGAVWQVVGG